MPRNGSGVYSKPAGTTAVPNTTIESAKYNETIDDLVADANAARPLTAGGTGATSKSDATTNLEAVSYGSSQTLTAAQQAQVRSNVSASLKGHIYGLTLSNSVSDPVNDIDIAAGEAASTETNPVLMILASSITKRLDAAWAVGTGNGGLDTGAIGNNTYHVWLIQRSDTGVVDALFSLSATSPTMPSGYDRKRRIGAIIRSAGAILAFVQNGDTFLLATSIQERNSTSAQASTLLTLAGIPAGVVVRPILEISHVMATTGNSFVRLGTAGKTLDNGDVYAQTILAQTISIGTCSNIFTDTSRRVQFEVVIGSGTLTSSALYTLGYVDRRGKD